MSISQTKRKEILRKRKMRNNSQIKTKEPITKLMTVHISPMVHNSSRKRRARYAVKYLRGFLSKQMGTADVKIDSSLNNAVWEKGIHNAPTRLRIKCERRMDENNDMITFASNLPVASFKNLQTVNE
ncbi:MAG: 60S ribosomal protein L31 [Marteilia pararefringens]